jgi:hypothetical protein
MSQALYIKPSCFFDLSIEPVSSSVTIKQRLARSCRSHTCLDHLPATATQLKIFYLEARPPAAGFQQERLVWKYENDSTVHPARARDNQALSRQDQPRME